MKEMQIWKLNAKAKFNKFKLIKEFRISIAKTKD
jgi:hypothetical protein